MCCFLIFSRGGGVPEDLKVAKRGQVTRLGSMAGIVLVNRKSYQGVGRWG